jgi:hypothetical protein
VNPPGGILHYGSQEQLGEINDKAERDGTAALEAQAEDAEPRVDTIENRR